MNLPLRVKNTSTSLRLAVGLFLSASVIGMAQTVSWTPVRVGGGGAVTSIQAHPKIQNLFFMTTDVGTPYRWNNAAQKWEGMFYKTLPANWENRNAAGRIAFVPGDTTGNILYATTGGPWTTNGTVLKSTNRGETWSALPIAIDVKPNSDQRAGQNIAVDPLNSNVVYVTTRSNPTVSAKHGTFKSTDAGASWTKINDLYGNFVQFDASSGLFNGVTKTIYIGCADGVYRSTDGGTVFLLMSGSPTGARKAALHSSGVLYVTHSTGVAKWSGGVWANITPPTTGSYPYCGIAVNPQNVNHVVTNINDWNSYTHWVYRSNNGGTSWTKITHAHDRTEVPWFKTPIGEGAVDVCWDPFSQNNVWFADFAFANRTNDIWAGPPVTWKSRAVGHEETVSIGTLLCPPSGTNVLLSSVADVGGWDHKSLTVPPEKGVRDFFSWVQASPVSGWGNMTGVAVQETNPNFIARVGRISWNGGGYGGYSLDGGNTYTKWTCPANAAGGRIAVSANSETMVWVTQSGASYRSTNRGTTWTPIPTLPSNIIQGDNVFNSGPRFPLAADKVDGSTFYVYASGRVYVSFDAGATFTQGGVLPISYSPQPVTVETESGQEGCVWVGLGDQGLHRSLNRGATFTKIANVQNAKYFAVGKASTANPTTPAIYVFGTVNNVADHLFRSNNNGTSWIDLGVPQIGTLAVCMAADRNVYGRVYFGTAGNGIMVGNEGGGGQEPSNEVVVDNNSPGMTRSEGWIGSSDTPGFYGTGYVHDGNTAKGSRWLRWTPDLPAAGNYEVFIRWTSTPQRATNVPLEIYSDSGTTPRVVNMQVNGGIWVSLGTYAFSAGTNGSVRISNAGTNGYVIADAVRFVRKAAQEFPGEVIVDNSSPGVGYIGTWPASTNATGFYGANYQHDDNIGKGSASFRWTPTLPSAGNYEVFIRWAAKENRATNVPVQTISNNGTATMTLNMQANGGVWVSLGVHPFNAGESGYVRISNAGTNGYVIADAVRFIKR